MLPNPEQKSNEEEKRKRDIQAVQTALDVCIKIFEKNNERGKYGKQISLLKYWIKREFKEISNQKIEKFLTVIEGSDFQNLIKAGMEESASNPDRYKALEAADRIVLTAIASFI